MSLFGGNIALKDKILFYESIANLLEGGVTPLSAIKGFSTRLRPGEFRDAVENTAFFVEGGDSINVAMRKIQNFYTDKEIAIVEAGEQTGMLRKTFNAIAEELRLEDDLKRKVLGALTYPFIVMLFLAIAVTVVMVYVIPQILPMITETTTKLTLSMSSLLFVSNFLQANIVYILFFLIALGFAFQGFASTPQGRKWIDREKMFLPVVGLVYKNYLVVQVMSTFHLLLSSGVSIIKTLHLTGESSGNVVIEEMYKIMAQDVSHGKKIFESMQDIDKRQFFFTPDILQMIESAERTSTVHEVANRISEQYKREVDASLTNMVKFIEPAALLIAGVFVLWFAIAIFSAIMQVVSVSGIQ